MALLKTLESLYPECWEQLELFRAPDFRRRLPWPDVCYVPIAAALAVVTKGMPVSEAKALAFRERDILAAGATLAGAAAWRIGKGVYRFDPEVIGLVADADLHRGVPWATLERLPEWAVYIETPGWTIPRGALHGFMAWIECDAAHSKELELRFVLHLADGSLDRLILPRADTIEAGLARLKASETRVAAEFGLTAVPTPNPVVAPLLERLVSLVLYLCASESDLEPPLGKPPPARPQPVKTRHGTRLFPQSAPVFYEVGFQLGGRLRQAREHAASSGSSVRPHLRRAHFHTYRVGEGRAGTLVKFLAPILVNADDALEGVTVKHVQAKPEGEPQ